RKHGYEKGTKYEAWMYAPEFGMDAPTRISLESHGKEKFTFRGKPAEGIKLVSTMHSKVGAVAIASWLDDEGKPLLVTMQMAGIPIEMLATDRESAQAEFIPTDLFTQSLLTIKTEIPPGAKSVVYQLRPKKNKQLNLQPEKNDFQSVRPLEGGAVEVTVKRANHVALLKAKGHSAGLDIKYKKSNVMIDSDDPLVQRLSKRASRGARNVFDLAHRLRHFVSRYVRVKNLEVGFATASEVARSREGDCSEHAVLLAAMGRASGLPSRVVAGLVYVPKLEGKTNVMGYHLWTQFHLRGRWVDFDAALNESECSPTRIALMASPLEDSSLTELGLVLLDYIGQVEIKVTKVE
ncbi:MAG: transglutaminase-like domain-containing protein, partial [Opitutales bacterium]